MSIVHENVLAIIGMASRFPGAGNRYEYWHNLREGIDAVRFFTDEELRALGVGPTLVADPAYVKAAAQPPDYDRFDSGFFGIHHREAEILDPQQRIFLETCWEALEDAAYDPEDLGLTGVFAGQTTSTYLLFNLLPSVAGTMDPLQVLVGNAGDSLATRVSYKLNLKGPSYTVQSACSTSAVAVHTACQSLLTGECDVALAGGVSINVHLLHGYRAMEGSVFAKGGRCRAFDTGAEGIIFGGGAGVVVLKRAEDAIRDGDNIQALILGSAVNNDGALKVGYTAPSVNGQAEVIVEAWAAAGVEMESASYIEAHGTGTRLGDPIEIQALTKAFRAETDRRQFIPIGSVKTNIGHLDVAAGIAGLIKTVLALKHREIPPSLHFVEPNPEIDFASSPVFVNTELRRWDGSSRRAGVSSFGFGGTNVHLVLEEAPEMPTAPSCQEWHLLPISARSEAALEAAAQNLAVHLERHPELDLADVAYTLQVGRRSFEHRRLVACRSREEAISCLRQPGSGNGEELGERWLAGEGLYEGERRRRVSLPAYPFERRRYWIDAPGAAVAEAAVCAATAAPKLHPRPSLFNLYVPPRDKREATVCGIWQEILGVEPVGVHDDFFELGGHSLLATQILSRVRDAFGIDFPLEHLFTFPTAAELAQAIRCFQEEASAPATRIGRKGQTIAPLSYAQERMWFLERLSPGTSASNIPVIVHLAGQLDEWRLELSLNQLVQRQEALRTRFLETGGRPVQEVLERVSLELPRVDLRGLPEGLRSAEEERIVRAAAWEPFCLDRAPLLRALLVKLAPEEHCLSLVLHHIVSDGWSLGVFQRDLAAFYGGTLLPELPIQYADYAAWQREQVESGALDNQLAWWRERLASVPILELRGDRPRPPVQTFRGGNEDVRVPLEVARSMAALTRRLGASTFMGLLAAFEALLHRYTGQEDFAVGTLVANRNRSETEGLIGVFINILGLRADLSGSSGFGDLLRRVRDATLDAYARQDLPFERLLEELQAERDLSRPAVFQAGFNLLNFPVVREELPGLALTGRGLRGERANFDLMLWITEEGEGLSGWIEYNADLFEPATMQRMAGHLERLLAGAVSDLELRIQDLPLMIDAERLQVLKDWNRTARPRPAEETFVDLFSAQVERTPDAVAAVCDGRSLIYRELDRRARSWARALRERGVGPESLVAILSERGLDFLTAVLAVFQAGGAYLPLASNQPAARTLSVLRQSGARWMVSGNGLGSRLNPPDVELIEMEALSKDGGVPLPLRATQENLAYVIFTSGSTGLPKGAMIHHRGLLNHLLAKVEDLELTASDVVAQNASQGFDISVWQLLSALAVGGRVHIYPDDVAHDPAALLGAAERDGLTILEVVPSLLSAMLDSAERPRLSRLRWMISTGEALPPELCCRWLARYPAIPLLNAYGPTECSDNVSHHPIRQAPGELVVHTPVGRPVANTQLYVLDRELRPLPAGVAGELCVGGLGVGRGYLADPVRTAQVFVPDPFGGEGLRLYRTGDLARWLSSREIEFLGRVDFQIKVRGIRIEPGEIESVLGRHSGVRQAVVLALERGGEKRLVAYLAGEGIEAPDLRSFARERLPEYMIPSAFVILAELPLMPNGKVDRRALPAPEWGVEEAFQAPATPAEQALARIWSEVLGIERVGSTANFFDLGGHSLLGARLISRLRDSLGLELPLRVLFQAPTLGELARCIDLLHSRTGPDAIPRRKENGCAPLSFAQERLWFLDRLEPGNTAYNLPAALRIVGRLDVSSLERCLYELIQRHETLRTTFPELNGEPHQLILPSCSWKLSITDLRALNPEVREREALNIAQLEAGLPFDLTHGPLLRTCLLHTSQDEWILLLTLHHIVSDGWSMGVFVREATSLYTGRLLPELPIQYADYAVWQRERLQGLVLEEQIQYWVGEMAGASSPTDLPTDRPRPAIRSSKGATARYSLPEDTFGALNELARREGATLFMALLAIFEVWLHRYSGQGDILVGTPVANRNRSETEDLIGFFVNTLVLRGRFDPPGASLLTVRTFLEKVKATCLEAFVHQDLPFERLVEELGGERSLSYSPIFQVMLALDDGLVGALDVPHLTVDVMDVDRATAQFDLSLSLRQSNDHLLGVLEYSTDLFDSATVARFLQHLRAITEHAVKNADLYLSDLSLLTKEEEAELRALSHGPHCMLQFDSCLHRCFEEQAERCPDALAILSYEGRALNYRELNNEASRLAKRLRRYGVAPEIAVGVYLNRSAELVIAMLAVFKAGGIYLPLDPSYPEERLAYILQDSQAPVVITASHMASRLGVVTSAVVLLDATDNFVESQTESHNEEPVRIYPENLAYIIYTSGSTGKPKGVGVCHGAAVEHMRVAADIFGLRPGERMLQFVSPGFDVTMEEVLPPLLSGAAVVPSGAEVWPSHEFLSRLVALGITTINISTAYWHQWVRDCENLKELPGGLRLRFGAMGGEAMSAEVARLWFRTPLSSIQLMNTYGPTETIVTATALAVDSETALEAGGFIPLGRLLAGRTSWVLDPYGNPCPLKVAGDLHLGGRLLARGYLGRPDLTAERFIPDPFGSPGSRLYRTGDLVRLLPDGCLEFLGRVDHQIKIRGFRIELGEIEAVLANLSGIREAVVLLRDDSSQGKSLIAYVVPANGARLDVRQLRHALLQELPEYMVPSAFAILDAIPLTPNGKIDQRALSCIRPESVLEQEFVVPDGVVEEMLAGIWCNLLGLDQVGANQSFFELGGHSLLAMRVVSRIREAFGVDLPLRRLFETPTIAGLARDIDAARAASQSLPVPPLHPRERGRQVPLSFAQERLWFLDQLDPGSPAYNIPSAVRLIGRLNVAALARALGEIVRRHEALRTSFTVGPEGVLQEIAPALRLPLPVMDLGVLPPERRDGEVRCLADEEARRPFDLSRGSLLRARLLRVAEEDHVLALNVHHIVADGWSVGVLVGELAALYAAFSAGRPSPLTEPPVQYADFALWQREWLRGEVLEAELAWWKGRLTGAPGFLPLPADRPRPPVQRFRGEAQREGLPTRIEQAVQELARREGATPFMALLAAFDTLLARYTGERDLVVGTPIAGRDRAETEQLIGLFLNTLALRVDLSGEPTFRDLLGRVREITLEAYAHSQLPFERLVEELAPEQDLSHAPIFQVLFVLQNEPQEPFDLPEVTLVPIAVDTATSKFDLVLNATETGEGLSLLWTFNRDLFDASRIVRLRGHFAALLEAALEAPGSRIADLPLLSGAERQQLLEWNATGNGWAAGPSLPEMIEEQVRLTPEAVAVSFEGRSLTYAELWERSGRVAAFLGARLDGLVGISAERSLELVIGLVGILRSGAGYVPIDPGYPAERIAYMVEDSGVAVLLDVVTIACLPPSKPAPVAVRPESLAYTIYTSGSTGRPKGAMNSHRAVRNRLLWMQEEYSLTPADRVLQKTPFGFDVSVWEFFWPLITGAHLVVARPGGHQDPAYLVETIERERITTVHFVPSMLRVFLEAPGVQRCSGLRRVICSGEALPSELVRRFFEVLPEVELHNLYGPTEAAVDVTAWRCGDEGLSVPIGRPIANTSIHLLDLALHRVPVGVPGELYIGGVQPARGYHRRPELTAERYIPDPFEAPGSRMYRTGDLARWRPDGAVEYLGRIDHQVKIRGVRIELGEIEAALSEHPDVHAAVVVARDSRLVAYVVGGEREELQAHLASRLPEAYLPSVFLFLDELPLSPNGKVDRKALPEPEASAVSSQQRVEPRTLLERFLAGLWSEMLGVESVGVHDSFFELGGNSITGAVLINRLQRELGEIVHVVMIFDAPTVARMASYLVREHRNAVVRLWGPESLTGGERGGAEIARVDEQALAEFRALIQPLPPLPPTPPAERNPPALFVLSPPRSGSTLLRVMLGGHPTLFSPPELELLSFNTMMERKAAFPGRDSFWLEGVIRAVMEARGCGPDEVRELVDVAEREDWSAQRFYRWLQESLGGRLLVDKTPSYALDAAILRRAEESFAGARYIHLIRHPYGMIRSFEEAKLDQLFFRRPHRFSRRALAELIWLVSHRNVAEFLAGIPQERQHWVRFEDLVRNPEGELRRICAFLEIEYHPDMADPYKETRSRMTDGIYAEGRMLGDVKFHQHRGVEAAAAERWRELSAEHALGDPTWQTAVSLGYERLAARDLTPIVRETYPPGTPRPLSFAQERLWFLDQLEPGSPLYNIPVALRLTGDLHEDALARSLAEIAGRHEVLRTTFADGPVQIVRELSLRMPRVDLSRLPDPMTELRRLAEAEARRPFDLARGPLFRATLVRLGRGDHAALVSMHHIVSDGWSIGLLVREAAALYNAFSQGQPSSLPELPVQYADFAAWQRRWLSGEILEPQIAYWKEALAGAVPLELPADRQRPAVRTPAGSTFGFALSAQLRDRATALARSERASLFMVLLTGFQALLHRISGQDDLSVGMPVAGRNRAEIEGLIGFFVNTLVLRSDGSGDPGFRELLARTRTRALGALAHQDIPFERLVEELAPQRDLARSPLFQVMFALQNAGEGALELPGLALAPLAIESGIAKFDLTLTLAELEEGLAGSLEASRDLYDTATVDRIAKHFEILLAGALADPDRPLSDLSLLSTAERHQLLRERDGLRSDYPRRSLPALFEEQAGLRPDAPAVIYGSGRLTYGELDRCANRLAAHLRRLGVGLGTPVAIYLERSLDIVVSTLAVLKAGGAYVPLDVSYPEERLAFMLEDVGAPVLITREPSLCLFPGDRVQAVCLDRDADVLERSGEERLDVQVPPEALAYVIYTSGSSGRPKGVAVPHRAVVRLVRDTDYVSLGPDDVLAQASNTSFDAATFEIWGALLNGGRLVGVTRETMLSPAELGAQIRRDGITTLFLTTALLNQVVDEAPAAFQPLRTLLFGGEAVDPVRVRTLLRVAPPQRLLHVYGPTESTTYASWHLVESVPEGASTVLIGRALSNTSLLVLDRYLEPVPPGWTGELYVGGDGLAWGYANRPELTAERFVPDPYGDGERLYRTGDLVRQRAGGSIEFVGRADFQVKIRGYRIELGDVEAALMALRGVHDAAVLVQGEGVDRRLIAYISGDAVAGDPRKLLAARLPAFMIPSAIVHLEALPLNANGKVDRKALARLEPSSESREEAHRGDAASRTPVQEMLAGIWTDLLDTRRVGPEDRFFDLGGHSLLATRLTSRVRELFKVDLPLRAVFEEPTLEELAERIERERESRLLSVPPVERRAPGTSVPLSFAQERLWFLDLLERGANTRYNIPIALRIRGQLLPRRVSEALNAVVERHESLRTTFVAGTDGAPRQVVSPSLLLPLPVVDLHGLGEGKREIEAECLFRAEAQRPFDLQAGPLLRPLLLRLGLEEHWLLLNLHHIVGDGWSVGVLIHEISTLYQGSLLPELPVQYGDFAIWQRRWLSGNVLETQISYWKEALADAPTVIELPTDRPRPPVQSFRGAARNMELPASLGVALHNLGISQGATLFMTLLAGFTVLLHRYTGQEDVLVGSPIANRRRIELEGLVGLFVNTIVLRGRLSSSPTFRELLDRVRVETLDAYTHQDLPFERLVEELRVERSLARAPLHQVVLALQNSHIGDVQLPGLTLGPLTIDSGTAKTDLLLALWEEKGRLSGAWEYSTDLFDAPTIDRLTGHLSSLLRAAAADPEIQIGDLPLLTAVERQQLLEWNDTRRPIAVACLHHLFEAWVERTPDAVAVAFEGKHLTYSELDARARGLAGRLLSLGVGPEVLVAICDNEGIDRVVAVLATFKVGGAYLPLDPSHPKERLAFLIEDARVRVLMTQSSLLASLPDSNAEILLLDDPPAVEDVWDGWDAAVTPDNLAYVIYTSGSTGWPNGVEVPHRAAMNLIVQAIEHFNVKPRSRVLQSVSFSFDASVLETWLALSAGATLCIANRASRMSGEAMADLICREEINAAVMTPSVLAGLPIVDIPSLQVVSVGGDRCAAELASRWAPPSSGLVRLLNCYGPTEASIYATSALCRGGYRREPPIGMPVGNMRAYVLDSGGQPVPVGVPGELFLSGEGIARGYLNRPWLTAARFVPNPFTPLGMEGERLYRTGDLVRRLPDGKLDFLGRLDGQVKIRGLRIEIGEVEAASRSHPAVKDCAVVVREDARGERQLVAFVVGPESMDAISTLRDWLRSRLPDYMVPARFVLLGSLPLSPTGKVDREILRQTDVNTDKRVEIRDPLELEIAQIWQDVLGIDRIGPRDNFFELGGHSLMAVRLIARVQNHFRCELPLSMLFHSGTVEQMAAMLRDLSCTNVSCLVPIQRAGNRPPLFFVHPAGGDVLCYLALARSLGSDQPFYGLQSPSIAYDRSDLTRIEDIAMLYLEEIRKVQPQGPYLLGGWSLGALIAVEMARQLRASEQEVAHLLVIDSPPAIGEHNLDDDYHSILLAIGRYVEQLWGKPVSLTAADLHGLDHEAALAALLEQLKSADLLPPNSGAGGIRRVIRAYQVNTSAARNYRFSCCVESVTLFRAAEGLHQQPLDFGWGDVLNVEPEVHVVPGNHITMLAEPNVHQLAGCILKTLDGSSLKSESGIAISNTTVVTGGRDPDIVLADSTGHGPDYEGTLSSRPAAPERAAQ